MDGTSDFSVGLWPAIVLAIGWAYFLVSEERRKHNSGGTSSAPVSGTSKAIAELRSSSRSSPASRARPTFDETLFLQQAGAAYEFILTRYAAGDMEKLAGLLEAEVLAAFSAETERRASAGEVMALEFVALDSTEIVDREFDDTTATIRVKFKSEIFLSEGQTDDKEAAAATLLRAIDIWTFRREHSSASPVWMLAATDSV
jgi:predicted lipid-binding transport protein (Tim44 family)